MNEIRSAWAMLIVLAILLFAFFGFALKNAALSVGGNSDLVNIRIASVPLSVEVADTLEEQKIGLSGRSTLNKDSGIFFIFDKPAKWRVTTRGMQFPIDIFWIDKNGKIVDMEQYATPNTEDNIFTPRAPATYILETNADFARIYNIKVGDYVKNL